MPLYTKAAPALVYDLINQANPGLSKPVSALNVKVGTPTAIANATYPAANTSIPLSSTGNGDYIGKQTVKYRRLDLSVMFRGIVVQIAKYKDLSAATSATVVYTAYTLLNDINAKFGMFLTQDDIADINIVRGSTLENNQYTTTVTVTTKATSLGYTGSFALKWINTAQDIATMITVQSINGRTFPGGNDFTSHDPIINSASFGIDFSPTIATQAFDGYPSGPFSQTTNSQTFLQHAYAAINAAVGTTFGTGITGAEMAQFTTFEVVTLPSAKYPLANSKDYNRLLTFTVPAGLTSKYGVGRAYFHYNV